MRFINKLDETRASKKVNHAVPFSERSYRHFKPLQITNELWLSVQAFYGAYCTPRKTLKNLGAYKTMEFALLNGNGDFITVKSVLPKFSRLEEIEEYEDEVYGYVPVELIEELYQALRDKAKIERAYIQEKDLD
jgi:hypothetical protein